MTAEVGVLNRTGVALAADSAVTAAFPTTKIYSSVDKLFQLSDDAPVGAMVYGSASFNGVPWETCVKGFRRDLARKSFPDLQSYALSLVEYLRTAKLLSSLEAERNLIGYTAISYLSHVRSLLEKALSESLRSKRKRLVESDILKALGGVVEQEREDIREAGRITELTEDFAEQVLATFREDLHSAIRHSFGTLPLPQDLVDTLVELVVELLASKRMGPIKTGLVVAGFGEEDVFPRLVEYQVRGRLCGQLLFYEERRVEINQLLSSCVIPFAQQEMVQNFMEGVTPDLLEVFATSTEGVVRGISEAIITEVQLRDRTLAEDIKPAIGSRVEELLGKLGSEWEKVRFVRYIKPVIEVVNALPKDELAAMAESLVNLTKFKRRVSQDLETVGGPVDVAVITKGDGFVWIKRKHYFEPELNPRFLSRYRRAAQ